jgi:glyoxylase-like metal-dependent hydrolase (beta-lactamase superfamily II)
VNREEIADGVFTVTTGDHRALFFGGVAVNSFGSDEAVRAYAEATGGPIESVIATIDHLDHTGRTEALGAPVIAHELCAAVIERRGAPGQRPADRVVRGSGEEVQIGGAVVRLLYPGPTQGTGGLAVHLPEQRVLFLAGPRADARYGLLPDFHLRHVTRIWRELASLDLDVVVPARGPVMTPAGLVRAADYIDAIKVAAQEAFAEGVPIWVIEAMEPFVAGRLRERFGDLDGFDRHIGIASIRIVHHYLMGGWGMEDTADPEALIRAVAAEGGRDSSPARR